MSPVKTRKEYEFFKSFDYLEYWQVDRRNYYLIMLYIASCFLNWSMLNFQLCVYFKDFMTKNYTAMEDKFIQSKLAVSIGFC